MKKKEKEKKEKKKDNKLKKAMAIAIGLISYLQIQMAFTLCTKEIFCLHPLYQNMFF